MLVICFLVFLLGTSTNANEEVSGLKIIGGNSSTILRHSYQVSISYNGTFMGSGAIISNLWVLTTASLLAGYRDLKMVKIRGKSDHVDGEGVTYRIHKIISHPRFSFSTMDYDVALLGVNKRIRFTRGLKKARLANGAPEKGVVSGWGSNSRSSYVYNQIKQINVTIVNGTACQQIYNDTRLLTNRMFCAVSDEYGPCWSDNGDPLVLNGTLYGLLSWNKGCFDQQFPSVFTKVSAVKRWVQMTVKEHGKPSRMFWQKRKAL
uniref:Peptidase S1 domain-containing protein n=1 Tax=Clastoptera arizonana TaxID=38151 RepID=A0A1B6BWM5_9HEMI